MSIPRRTSLRLLSFVMIAFAALSLSGCLSLSIGGKTHNCGNDKETKEHIARLESRLKMLEQYAGITPPQTLPLEQKSEINMASHTEESSR